MQPAEGIMTIATRELTHEGSIARFRGHFPKGFADPKYLDLERNYKWEAHELWTETLEKQEFERLIENGDYGEIVHQAMRVESRTNLLATFEKAALRDAVKNAESAKVFSQGLYDLIYGQGAFESRFD